MIGQPLVPQGVVKIDKGSRVGDGKRVLVDEGKAKGIHSFTSAVMVIDVERRSSYILLEEFKHIPVLFNKGSSYPRVGTGYQSFNKIPASFTTTTAII